MIRSFRAPGPDDFHVQLVSVADITAGVCVRTNVMREPGNPPVSTSELHLSRADAEHLALLLLGAVGWDTTALLAPGGAARAPVYRGSPFPRPHGDGS